MSRKKSALRRIKWAIAGLIGLFVAFNVYIGTAGVPKWLLNEIMHRASKGGVAVEADAMQLRFLRALSGTGLKVYARGMPGPPFLSAEHAAVTLNPLACVTRAPLLRAVRLENVQLTPSMIAFSGSDAVGDEAPESGSPLLDVHVTIRNCMLDSLAIEHVTGRVRLTPKHLLVEQLRGTIAGDREGETVRVSGRFAIDLETAALHGRLRVEGALHPLIPALECWGMVFTPKLIGFFTPGAEDPVFELDISRDSEAGGVWDVGGRFWLEDTAYRNVDTLIANGRYNLHISTNASSFQVDPFYVVRSDGLFMGGLEYRSAPGVSRISYHADSSVDPYAFFGMVGILTNYFDRGYQFEPPIRITVHGTNDFRHSEQSDVVADISSGRFRSEGLDLKDVSFRFEKSGYTMDFKDFESHFCDGIVRADYTLTLPPDTEFGPAFLVKGEWRGVDFGKLLARHPGVDAVSSKGMCRGNLTLMGIHGKGQQETLSGQGTIVVADGEILRLPILGGLTEQLAKAVPGFDVVVTQTDGRAKFYISNGFLTVEEFRVEGDILSIHGKGRYQFGGELDMEAEISFFKSHTLARTITRLPTWVFSKLFKFRLRGTLDAPRWYPVNFSTDIWERIGLGKAKEDEVADTRFNEDEDAE